MASTPQANNDEVSQIASLSAPAVDEIPFHLVSAHERKTTKLLKNAADHQSIKSRNSYFSFSFEAPIFLFSVRITIQDFADGEKFEYFWEGIDGRKHVGDASVKTDEIYIYIKGMARSVAFKPPRTYFTRPYIESVDLYGFEISQAGDFIEFADDVSRLRKLAMQTITRERALLEEERGKVNALQAQRGSLSQDIATLKSNISREQGRLKRVETQRDEIVAKNGLVERAISDEESRLSGIKSEIKRSSSIRSRLAQRIIDKTEELRELQSNIHLFPSELSEFSRQGAKDSRTFFWLSLIPMAVIVLMFVLLVKGAADLTTKITGSDHINIVALGVSRTPYVVIACTIITASYYVLKMLILEMVRISRQRLALTKISIIAKDLSTSIDSDLDLTDDERYTRRLTLKMDLMKDHLQEYLSADFSPTLPQNIAPSLTAMGLPSIVKDSEALTTPGRDE